MRIGIIDYGAGNLQSVRNALHALGHDPAWIKTAADLETLAGEKRDNGTTGQPGNALIFPGQGEFRGCVESLRERDLFDPLRSWLEGDRPFFGICLGYQVLFESSEEAPDHPGLGIFKGTVQRFTQERLSGQTLNLEPEPSGARQTANGSPKGEAGAPSQTRNSAAGAFKIPHMGWNEILPTDPSDPLWRGLDPRPHAYFVHSYYPVPADPAIVATTTRYGAVDFASSIRRGNAVATQFHPEKSQQVGLTLLRNFLDSIEKPIAPTTPNAR